MRLPFPERLPLPLVVIGATVLVGLQTLQHTDPYFSLFSFLFLVIAALAFNTAGGFTQTSGSYIFFYAVLGVIVGLVYKAYLGEPADSNLHSPLLTIQVFTGGITAMLLAAIVSKKITRRRPLLQNVLKDKDLRTSAVGCLAVGVVLTTLNVTVNHGGGSLLSALTQLNRFLQMSVVVATIATIKKTQGKSGFSALVWICLLINFGFGVLGFSKEGMFAPFICWLATACSMRLNLKTHYLAFGAAAVYIMFHFFVPYSQYGRDQVPEDPTFSDRIGLSVHLLSDLGNVRELYLDQQRDAVGVGAMDYYNEPQGLYDRLNMIGPDDALIHYTDQGNFAGLGIIPLAFANWVPHFLWPSKPTVLIGNVYARNIGGIVGEEDLTTGISFSPTGEAYHLAGWAGVFLVAPLIWIALFTLFDSLCGDIRKSPWGIIVISIFSHTAPEGMLGGAIYVMWFGTISILVVAMATAYVMPVIGTLLVGPEKTGLMRFRIARPKPLPHPHPIVRPTANG